MIACVLLPLLPLRAALGKDQARLLEPVALAPRHDGPRLIGEISPTARQRGVRPGMKPGEAVDICPEISLISPDPARARQVWETTLARVESIGAAVESERDGEAFFDADGLELLHGGLGGVLDSAGARLGPDFLLAAAPTRLAAIAMAEMADPQRRILPPEQAADFLARLPLGVLLKHLPGSVTGTRHMLNAMHQLGLKSLGDLVALPADAVADRFGPAGLLARDLALGREGPIRPRIPFDPVAEWLELPEPATGAHLESGLTILCDRISGRLQAAGIGGRTLAVEARLLGGGSWSHRASPRQPTASPTILRLLFSPVLARLPRPAERLGLLLVESSPCPGEQLEVLHRPGELRRRRLGEAARQVRAAVGKNALLRILDTEPESRLPERRMLLSPYQAD